MTAQAKGTRAGWYLRDIALAAAQAAGWIDPNKRADWRLLCEWLDAGMNPHAVIIPAIKRAAERAGEPVHSLRFFDGAVRSAAAAAGGRRA
jgi:hypothetical protein